MRITNNHIVILLFMLLVSMTGCIPKPIDIKVEPAPPKLVISSQVIPERVMIVSVTKSFSALAINANEDTVTNDFLKKLLVEHAFVTVSYNNRTDTLEKVASGIYASVNTLQEYFQTYTVFVHDSTTGMEVTASTEMLPQVSFDTIVPEVHRYSSSDDRVKINYSFTDPNGDNWYAINIVKKNNDSSSAGFDVNNFFKIGANVTTQTILISDKTFEGPAYRDTVLVEEVTGSDSIVVTISNISQGYFQFLDAQSKSQGLLSSITQEPINRPSNVAGGYGYFNAHFPDIKYFDLNDY